MAKGAGSKPEAVGIPLWLRQRWPAIFAGVSIVLGGATAISRQSWLGWLATLSAAVTMCLTVTAGRQLPRLIAESLQQNYAKAFVIGVSLSTWVYLFAVFLASAIRTGTTPEWQWSIEWSATAVHPSYTFAVLLGSLTISGLVIAIARIQEAAGPKAIGLGECLHEMTAFINEAKAMTPDPVLCLSSYYPSIGAVTKAEEKHQLEYTAFRVALETYGMQRLRVVTLRDGESEEGLYGRRPGNRREAMKDLAWAFYDEGQRDEQLQKATQECTNLIQMLDQNTGAEITEVSTLPDFHYILTMGANDHPKSAYVLLTLHPPGVLATPIKNGPAFIGIRVYDGGTLTALKRVWDWSVGEADRARSATQPVMAKPNGDGSGLADTEVPQKSGQGDGPGAAL